MSGFLFVTGQVICSHLNKFDKWRYSHVGQRILRYFDINLTCRALTLLTVRNQLN
ncbi:hypothetical protein BgiMline_020939, partial [Biomphalaria glabrata]